MPETPDPVAALAASDIPTRAAACRDLGAAGDPAHLDRLLAVAVSDTSPGVRLNAAAALADILSRHRLPPRDAAFPQAAREALWARLAPVEPGVNPGLFQVAAELRLAAGRQRVLGGLRDPRLDVRVGAVVGLTRLCASAASNGDEVLEDAVIAALGDPRIRVETRGDIARLCANMGLARTLDAVRALAGASGRAASATAGEAAQRLEWPPSMTGIWVDLGVDALAADTAAPGPGYLAVVDPSTAVWARADAIGAGPLPSPRRVLHVKRPGAVGPTSQAETALQVETRTYWASDADDVAAFSDRLLAAERFDLVARVDAILPISASTVRLRGAALLRAGDAAGAADALASAGEMKKAPADTWWWLAEALEALGKREEAREALERFVSKSPKRAPHVAAARKRLER